MRDGRVIGICLGELTADPSGDLSDLKRMGQSGAVEIAVAEIEDLGLALQSPEGSGVDDPPIVDVELASGVFLLLPPRTAARQPNVSHDSPPRTRRIRVFGHIPCRR